MALNPFSSRRVWRAFLDRLCPQRLNPKKRRRRSFRPDVESFEERIAPAVYDINLASGTFPGISVSSLATAIADSDGNADKSNVINLGPGAYTVVDQAIFASSAKTLLIAGQGAGVVLSAGGQNRVFEINANVGFENLTITGGDAHDGGTLGGAVALGGGLLIDGGEVGLSNVVVKGNEAVGAHGAKGLLGAAGGQGGDARGGGIYLAAGTLILKNSIVTKNSASGGVGGTGGPGVAGVSGQNGATGPNGSAGARGQNTGSGGPSAGAPGVPGGRGLAGGSGSQGQAGGSGANGGNGGNGGNGLGGGIYIAAGNVTIKLTSFTGDNAIGGKGGPGGRGGKGGAGGNGGIGGSGGAGGAGGTGAPGSFSAGSGSAGPSTVAGGIGGTGGSGGTGGNGGAGGAGGAGGLGGAGGNAGSGLGGGIYLGSGSLLLASSSFAACSALGGAGGRGGPGGAGGNGGSGASGGNGGSGGAAGPGGAAVPGALPGQYGASGFGGAGGNGGMGGAGNNAGSGGPGGYGGSASGGCIYTAPGLAAASNGLTLQGMANAGQAGIGGISGTPGVGGAPGYGGSPAYGSSVYGAPGSAGPNGSAAQSGPSGGQGASAGVTIAGEQVQPSPAQSQAPIVQVTAPNVSAANAASEEPYTFSVVYQDSNWLDASTFAATTASVLAPDGSTIPAQVVNTTAAGATDVLGDAVQFTVAYQITAPGGSWITAPQGSYAVVLSGTPASDLAGNLAPTGTVGTFSVATYYQVYASQNENATPTPLTVSSLLATHYWDPDGTYSTPGIAVIGMNGNGAWQYSANGSTWTALSNVGQTDALLLPGSDSVRFVPAANTSGAAKLYFVAWDGSQGSAGSRADVTNGGGTSPFSINVGTLALTVNPVPIWLGAGASFTPVAPGLFTTSDPDNPPGDSVSAVFGNYSHDDNPNASLGVAVVGLTGTSNGVWQFSLGGPGAWNAIPTNLSATSALLLAGDDYIRFVPNNNFAGVVSLKALAWDGSATSGVDGTQVRSTGANAGDFSPTTMTATCGVNNAPTVNPATLTGASVAQYATGGAVTVSSLLTQSGYADPDGKSVPQGMAILASSLVDGNGNPIAGPVATVGTFQYLLSGGTWQPLPNVAVTSALLLPSNASLRFVAGSQTGTATLIFEGWDQTQGIAGQTADSTNYGGATAFSINTPELSIAVTPSSSHAPVLIATSLTEPMVPEYATGAAVKVSSLLTQVGYADQNTALPQGIAVVGAASAGGTEQYMLAGGTWQSLPGVSTTSALLLPSTASLRLIAAGQLGTATLTFDGWDQTQGTAGQLFDIANTGGASAFSTATAIASTPVGNIAPTLSVPSVPLAAINQNVASAAVTAATLLGKAGYAGAGGTAAPSGIAVTGDTGPGVWQWLDGSSWTALPSVSKSSVFLLPGATPLRFDPNDSLPTNTNGLATLTYLGWDEAAGAADTIFSLSSQGGASAFSTAAATVSMPINFVKPAPTWVSGATASLTPVVGYSTAANPTPNPAGDTVAAVFGSAFHDAPSVSAGVAIAAQSGTSFGVWQYSTNNGTTWQTFPTALSTGAVLLLTAKDRIRFVPSKSFSGTVSLTAYAWDGTGNFTSTANLTKTGTGGATPFSAATLTATCLVNSAPTLM